MSRLIDYLLDFGAREPDWVSFTGKSEPRWLRYADLIRTPGHLVDGVVEQQSQPLLYVLDGARLATRSEAAEKIVETQRSLAMRGEPAWLGVLKPGRLDIYATDPCPELSAKPVRFLADDAQASAILPRLVNGEDLAEPAKVHLRDTLFGLITDAGRALHDLGLSTSESIALTGRALFFRYLMGRGIIEERHRSSISKHSASLHECFSNHRALAETNTWLDLTFNGDLLALPGNKYERYFADLDRRYGKRLYRPLQAILGLETSKGSGASQLQLDWGDLEFDHLPIGLLSEAYEELMLRLEPKIRKKTSVYYTPARIAEYMVAEALHEHPAKSRARILDPACGAGVFLVAAFRKLAEKRFAETGKRPDRSELRTILDGQLTGFDINAHARTLAALALYLTALELDPNPTPVEALTFRKLEDRVLIDVSDPIVEDKSGTNLMAGSLGKHMGQDHHDQYDLVIGNPPWTNLPKDHEILAQQYTQRSREAADARGLKEIARTYKNPNHVPDLPFVWAAMDWAKSEGRIALALHGRWLFKMSKSGINARKSLFQALAITGILNGASIRQTKVWPNTTQPFCLLFADNRLPRESDQFVLVNPEKETSLNEKGRMRIDANDALPVENERAARQPWVINALYRGGRLDSDVLDRLFLNSEQTIDKYWAIHSLALGNGYKVSDCSEDDEFLRGIPDLNSNYDAHPYHVHTHSLEPYVPHGLQRPRKIEIYKAPLILVREGSREDRNRGRVLLSLEDVVYSKSYYGLSTSGHRESTRLARYLQVILHSQLFEYVFLLTSGRFGREREALQFLDIKRFPFVPMESLGSKTLVEIDACARRLAENQPDFSRLDRIVAHIYNLNERDQQVIRDTLETRAPFAKVKHRSADSVESKEAKLFCKQLGDSLASVFANGGYTSQVHLIENESKNPWRFIAVFLSKIGDRSKDHTALSLPAQWTQQADDLAATRVTLIDPERPRLTIGLLNQYRYWTLTQARLLASNIIWEHGAMLEEKVNR